ncbi:MAG: ABC transporter permease [Clostridiaceae bacterium]|jgi:ABC-2 type transport system permease protein|nr:ABC transporter permease [Clostridiaceae bacterium]
MRAFKLYFKVMRGSLATIITYIGIFVVITSFVIKAQLPSEEADLKIEGQKITVFDADESQVSKAFTVYLADHAEIVELEDTEIAINDALFDGDTHYVIRIPQGFGKQMLDPERHYAELNARGSVYVHLSIVSAQLVESYNQTFQVYKQVFGGTIPTEHLEETLDLIQTDLQAKVTTRAFLSGNASKIDLLGTAFNNTFYIIIALLSSVIGGTLIAMENQAVKWRDLVSGVPERQRTFGIFLATLLFSVVLWVFLIVFLYTQLGFDLLSDTKSQWLIGVSFVHMVTVLAIANFFITLLRNKGALTFFSTVFSLALSFTSGVFVPLEFIQTPVQKVASFMPTVWAVKANNTIVNMSEQAPDYSFIWQAMGIMALMAVAFLCLTLVIRRSRLRSHA